LRSQRCLIKVRTRLTTVGLFAGGFVCPAAAGWILCGGHGRSWLIFRDEGIAFDAALEDESRANADAANEDDQTWVGRLLDFEICVVTHRREEDLVGWAVVRGCVSKLKREVFGFTSVARRRFTSSDGGGDADCAAGC